MHGRGNSVPCRAIGLKKCTGGQGPIRRKNRPNLPNGYRRTLLLPKPPAAIRQEPAGRHAKGVHRGAAEALREDGHGAAGSGFNALPCAARRLQPGRFLCAWSP